MIPLQVSLEELDKYFDKNKQPEWRVTRARTRALIRSYDACWQKDNGRYEVLGVERMMLAPLKSLLTLKDSGYLAGGKLDVILREYGDRKQTLIMDHKFLAWEFDNDDIEHLLIAGQQNQYAYLGWASGIVFQGAIWDVIRKPLHKPRAEGSRIVKAAKPERELKRAWTDKNGVKHPKGAILPASEEVRETTPAETMEEFEERIYQTIVESPEKWFSRPRVPVLKNNMAQHIQDVYEWTRELDIASKSDRPLKNTEACMEFNRPCEYLGLCSGKSSEDDGTWTTKDKVHPELDLPEGVDPHRVVTNSRLKCFKSCRLKHHRKYNQGLVKINQKLDESLYVGTAGHLALEAFWKAVAATQGKRL